MRKNGKGNMCGVLAVLLCLALAGPELEAQFAVSDRPVEAMEVVDLGVGEAVRLKAPGGDGEVEWSASDPDVVQVFGNGYAFGLKSGETLVLATRKSATGRMGVFPVRVAEKPLEIMDPATIRQYPDDRRFDIAEDRECYGCSLNCRQAGREGTRANRVVNPNPPGHELYWLVEPGTQVVDGRGIVIGTIVPVKLEGKTVVASKFNHGMTKVINGEVHVYAFATRVKPAPERGLGEGSVGVSAWLPLSRVVDKEVLLDNYDVGSGRMPALPLEDKVYRITGGRPEDYLTEDGEELSIIRQVSIGAAPQDYLRRPAGTINIIYCVPGFGLGGHGVDSFLIDDALRFRPAKGVRQFVMPTYWPRGHAKAGEKTDKTETFVYGGVDAPGTERVYGWVALEALEAISQQ